MAVGLFGTGISSLLASQKALATASHNIANVNTDGYSRQRVNTATQTPFPYGNGFIGTGVKITSIERVYDQYLVDQVRTGTSSLDQLSQFYSLSTQVDNLLADPQAGLSPSLQDFFNAIQDVADDPSSASARQVLISTAQTLSDRFNYLNERIDNIDNSVNADIQNVVSEINGLSESLANINKQIADARNQANAEPNDLLDKRDNLLKQLSERVGITTALQDDGSVNVFVGNGQAIVTGYDSRTLSAIKNDYDPNKLDIGYDLSGTTVDITSQLSGGKIGGFLKYRSEMSDSIKNSLGLLAVGLTETFNQQQQLGIDLNGNMGGDFFTNLSSNVVEVLPSRSNTAASPADISATIADANSLTGSDYTLRRDGVTYTLTRESDNFTYTLTSFPAGSETIDGVTLTLAGGAIADGDRFLIRPVRSGASDISVAVSDPAKIAAASPIRSYSNLNNSGSASINPGEVTDIAAFVSDTYHINMTSATTYEVRDSTNTLLSGGVYTSGADIVFNGITVAVTGSPQAGDTFIVEPNTSGIGDNSNAIKLGELQLNDTLKGNTVSYQSLYGQMVVSIGSKTNQANINVQAQQGLLDQAIAAREAKSGVNLDEEAADLVKYQQLYQAAARIIQVADTTFQSILSLFR